MFRPLDEDQPDDPDVQALLMEIDASLNRFESAVQSFQWLGDEGVHAGELDRKEAENARLTGKTQFSEVDLARFVPGCRGCRRRGLAEKPPTVSTCVYQDTWRVRGLEELPGWDAEKGRMHITNDTLPSSPLTKS